MDDITSQPVEKSPDTVTRPFAALVPSSRVQAQEEHSKHKFRFTRQVKDPSRVYLLAGWDSLETHIAQRVHYQGQLVQLADRVGVDRMFHLDADPSTFSIPFEAPIIAIAITPFSCCGAWRIVKGEDEEYVFFSGWKEIQNHANFERSQASEDIGKINELVKGVEVKHVHVQKWK